MSARASVVRLGCVLSMFLIGCVPDGQLKIDFNWEPLDVGDGWEIAAPEEVGFSREALLDAYEVFFSETNYVTAISMLVVRHDRLVAEGYCRSLDDRYLLVHVQSVTKSITSLVFGIARAEGHFEDLDAPLYDYLPGAFDDDLQKRQITLRHLLTMRSGISFDNAKFSTELQKKHPSDPMKYILAKSMYNVPGAEFYYRDADPHLIAGAIRAVTGETPEQIARRSLFDPMGIETWVWEDDSGGTSFGPYGLFARPRDLAKVGRLVLDGGVWEGQQLVPGDWIAEATSFQTEPDTDNPNEAGFGYGYYWWTVPEMSAFTASGHGGNFIFIVPSEDLVLVFTCEPSGDDDTVGTRLREFLPLAKRIVGAIVS